MATCAQQLTWHLKKEMLEKMLQAAGGNYSALEFKMCVTRTAETKYYMRLISVDTTAQNPCDGAVTPLSEEEEVCPVPPDCNDDPPFFQAVLDKYYNENTITFTLDKNTFIEAFK